jgi:hypothetical protein
MKTKKRLVVALMFLSIAVAACRDQSERPPKPAEQDVVQIVAGEPFTLKAGQKATFNNDELSISFSSVSEDSRCAIGVECIWEGQVTAVFRVVVAGEAIGDKSLTVRGGQPDSVEFNGYTLSISAVDPYPKYQVPINAADYMAMLTLAK